MVIPQPMSLVEINQYSHLTNTPGFFTMFHTCKSASSCPCAAGFSAAARLLNSLSSGDHESRSARVFSSSGVKTLSLLFSASFGVVLVGEVATGEGSLYSTPIGLIGCLALSCALATTA